MQADSIAMGLMAVPHGVDEVAVRRYLSELDGVKAVHDLHIWSMSTTDTALTAHLVIPAGHPGDRFLHDVALTLRDHHRIAHATLQVERSADCSAGC